MILRRPARLVLLVCACGPAAALAVDCKHANLTHSERAVCGSASLRKLDASVSQRIALVAGDGSARQSQYAWLQQRDRCNGNIPCLTRTYNERNAYLAAVTVAPTQADAIASSLQQLLSRHGPSQPLVPVPPSLTGTMLPVSASDELNRAAGPQPAVNQPASWKPLWFLGGMLLAELLLWKMLTNRCGRCPHCHHWFARMELDRATQTDDSVMPPLLRRRRFRHRALAAHGVGSEFARTYTTTVRHHNQCRMCLHEWETTSRESR